MERAWSGHIMELCDDCNNCTGLYRKSLERYSMFCDFTPLCVHTAMSQVIQPAKTKILDKLATKSATTIKQTPLPITLKALLNNIIKN